MKKRISGLCMVRSAIMSVSYGLWWPIFFVLCEEDDVVSHRRVVFDVYHLQVSILLFCFRFCGGCGGKSRRVRDAVT